EGCKPKVTGGEGEQQSDRQKDDAERDAEAVEEGKGEWGSDHAQHKHAAGSDRHELIAANDADECDRKQDDFAVRHEPCPRMCPRAAQRAHGWMDLDSIVTETL